MANAYKALLDAVELLALGAKQILGLGESGLARQVELAQHLDAHCAMGEKSLWWMQGTR